ncbi:MAG: SAM-dependent DNA methyltransferase, partial [Chlorobiales bacterium]|nr:SAM-dependent DNA methyltransferase [Chlorobiales bacterium]
MSTKKEFGDFQTPESLAVKVVALVANLFDKPDIVIEPTSGLGAFLKASSERWKDNSKCEGYEINKEYVQISRECLSQYGVQIFNRDFFTEDWKYNLSRSNKSRILIIGNPPWVTNAELGQLGSTNLPRKTNFQNLRGFDAQTGKSNFDIAEWMLIRLIEALPSDGALAMLCKTMTARKVLRHIWKTDEGREGSRLFHIDAKAEFDVAVDACLFFITGKHSSDRSATVYSDLNLTSETTRFGLIDGDLVSDLDAYEAHKHLGVGSSIYTWRSGVKHDASKVMEFTRDGHRLINGFGESVEIEDDYVFPLLKSSDLGNGRISIRKSVLVTQKHTGDDTSDIEYIAPKTWRYLMHHVSAFDGRKSSIYENRPRFSVFGIGSYSFAPWKIAISGLYKKISFVEVSPFEGRPVMVDDTCYSIPCQTQEEAELLIALLSSVAAKEFLRSLIFLDSKRPITIDVLRRLSLVELARDLGRLNELQKFVQSGAINDKMEAQMSLLLEKKQGYIARRPSKRISL